jgi:hypothetical protein
MNEYLEIFDTIRLYTPWSILRILWDFSFFLIQIWTGGNRSEPEPVQTVRPDPTVSGPVPTGSVNHGPDKMWLNK